MASENKLYNALSSSGFYTKPQSDFESQFATPEAQSKLYNKLRESEYYTKDENSFKQQFFTPTENIEANQPPSVNIPMFGNVTAQQMGATAPATPVTQPTQTTQPATASLETTPQVEENAVTESTATPNVNIPMFGNVTPEQMESAPAMQTEEKAPLTLTPYPAMEMEKEVVNQKPASNKLFTRENPDQKIERSDILQGYKTEAEKKVIEGNIIEKKAKQDAAQFAIDKNDFDKQSGANIDAIHVADSLYKKINSGEITDKDEIKNFNDVILPQAKAQQQVIDNNYVQWGLNNIADKTKGNRDAKLAGLVNNYFKALSPDSETLGDEYDILDKIHQLDPTWQPDMSLLNPKNEQLRKEQYQNNVVYYNQKKRDYKKAVQNAINDSRDLHNEQDVEAASVGLLAGYDSSLERFKKAQAELGDAGNSLKSSYQSYILKKNIGKEFEESQIPYLSPIANLAISFLGGVVKDIVPAVQKEGMGITTSINTLPEQQRLALIQEEQQKQYKEEGVIENENIQPSISEKVGGLGGEMVMFLGRQAILAPFIETGLNSGAALIGLKNLMGEAGIASNLMRSKSLGAKTLGVFAHGLEEGTKMALSTGDSEQFKMGAEFGIAGQLGKALPILIKGNPFLTGAIKTMVGSGSTVAGVEAYKLAEASANYMMNQDDFNESLKKSGIDADNLKDYSKQKIAETLVFGILGLKGGMAESIHKQNTLDRLDRINKIREDLKKNGVPEQEIESIVNPSNDLIMANAVKIGKELGSENPITKLPQADKKVAISLNNELERIKARYEGKVDESKPLADQIAPEDMKRVDEIHNQLMSLKNKYFKPTIEIDNSANEPAATGATATTGTTATPTEAAPTKKPSLSESILGELEQTEAPPAMVTPPTMATPPAMESTATETPTEEEVAIQRKLKQVEVTPTPATKGTTETKTSKPATEYFENQNRLFEVTKDGNFMMGGDLHKSPQIQKDNNGNIYVVSDLYGEQIEIKGQLAENIAYKLTLHKLESMSEQEAQALLGEVTTDQEIQNIIKENETKNSERAAQGITQKGVNTPITKEEKELIESVRRIDEDVKAAQELIYEQLQIPNSGVIEYAKPKSDKKEAYTVSQKNGKYVVKLNGNYVRSEVVKNNVIELFKKNQEIKGEEAYNLAHNQLEDLKKEIHNENGFEYTPQYKGEKQAQVETTTEAPVKQPIAETPVAETPVAEIPVVETPVVKMPVAETTQTGSVGGEADVVTNKGKMEGVVTDYVEVGDEKVALPQKGYLISGVSLNEGQQKGIGSGQEIYKKALDEHGTLYSSFPISEDAMRVQDKLVEKGIAKIETITLSDGTELRKIESIKEQPKTETPAETTTTEPAEKTLADALNEVKSLPRKAQIKKATNKLIDKHFENIFAQLTLKEPNKYKRIC